MKRICFYGVWFILILATLACRLPYFSRALEAPVVSTEGTDLEEPTPPASQPTAMKAETLQPTMTIPGEGINKSKTYRDNGVEITLPSSYTLGDVEKDLQGLLDGLNGLSGVGSAGLKAVYEQNKEDILMWAYDQTSSSQPMTNLIILKNEEFAGMSLAIVSVFANTLLGDAVDSMSKERMTLAGREVLRFSTTTENAGVETAQAIYLFNESGKLWVIGFFTNLQQIDQLLSTFDAAVASFTILPGE